MRRSLTLIVAVTIPVMAVSQSKIGHINSEQIMQTLPEAQDAQRSLDNMISQWENELQKMQTDWKRKFDEYDKKKLIPPIRHARTRSVSSGSWKHPSPTSGTKSLGRTASCSRSRTR
jgi:Skp family chaperone for outer membrane proteins